MQSGFRFDEFYADFSDSSPEPDVAKDMEFSPEDFNLVEAISGKGALRPNVSRSPWTHAMSRARRTRSRRHVLVQKAPVLRSQVAIRYRP